jgi:hypothetical protein
VGAQTDPRQLWAYQIERRKQWDSIYGTVVILAFVAPIGLALIRSELAQVLKVTYFFFAVFIAMPANGLASATSILSALFSMASCFFVILLLMPGIQWITRLTPKPEWYVLIIPLWIGLHVATETFIPQIERSEWRDLRNIHQLSDQQLQLVIKQNGIATTSSQKVQENIFAPKPETVWEKIIRRYRKNNGINSPVSIASRIDKNSMPTVSPAHHIARVQELSKRSPQQNHIRVDTDELQALQDAANEALKKICIPESQHDIISMPSSLDSAKVIAAKYQDAVSRDDLSALRQLVSAEMSITQDCEQALLRGTASASTQLQIDKQGGSYLLIRQDNKNWLVPTFLTLKSFTTIQRSKGLFVYEPDNVSSAELRRPAEVREDRGVWEVVNMGVVAVPN